MENLVFKPKGRAYILNVSKKAVLGEDLYVAKRVRIGSTKKGELIVLLIDIFAIIR